jgi:hypothetical protein
MSEIGKVRVTDYLTGPCSGQTLKSSSGVEYTWPLVDSYTNLNPNTNLDPIPGSSITYTPPANTLQVTYRFQFLVSPNTDPVTPIGCFRFYIDSNEVEFARFVTRGDYNQNLVDFEWTMRVGGTTGNDLRAGIMTSWTTPKTMKMTVKSNSGTTNGLILHGTWNWEGVVGPRDHTPILSIIATGFV